MPRRRIERLSPEQEKFLANAITTLPPPFRSDFEADVRNRLGEWPSNAAVACAVDLSLNWFQARLASAKALEQPHEQR